MGPSGVNLVWNRGVVNSGGKLPSLVKKYLETNFPMTFFSRSIIRKMSFIQPNFWFTTFSSHLHLHFLHYKQIFFFGRQFTTLERAFVNNNILRPPHPPATSTTPRLKSGVVTPQPPRIDAYDGSWSVYRRPKCLTREELLLLINDEPLRVNLLRGFK